MAKWSKKQRQALEAAIDVCLKHIGEYIKEEFGGHAKGPCRETERYAIAQVAVAIKALMESER